MPGAEGRAKGEVLNLSCEEGVVGEGGRKEEEREEEES